MIRVQFNFNFIRVINSDLYYIHFVINGISCNLIGSHECDFNINDRHEKILHFDWLRAVQFLGNIHCQKIEIQSQEKRFP